MTARCTRCGHAEHRRACPAKAPSGCVPIESGWACYRGARPPCTCPLQVCRCGLPVAVAALDGTGFDAAFVRVPDPGGDLAVRTLPDRSLACRPLDGGPLRPGELAAREHREWPDHGAVAAEAWAASTA